MAVSTIENGFFYRSNEILHFIENMTAISTT